MLDFVISVTERGILTFVTSAVTHALAAHIAHPYAAVIAMVIVVFVTVVVVIFVTHCFCLTVVTDSVIVLIDMAGARHEFSTYVTNAVTVLVRTQNSISANVTTAIAVVVCT